MLVERCTSDPARALRERAAGDALADQLGGDPAFAWHAALVGAAIAASRAHAVEDDVVRELYGEMVDRYRDDPARMVELRVLGDEIRRLEASGELASSLVARSDRHRR